MPTNYLRASMSNSSRRGSAGVELAICFPMLVLMGIVLAWIAYAGMVRSNLATQSRNHAWRQRSLVIAPEYPLNWKKSRQQPMLTVTASQIYELKILAFSPVKAESTSAVIAGTTWDVEAVQFSQSASWGIHRDVWNRLDSDFSLLYSPVPVQIVRDGLNAL